MNRPSIIVQSEFAAAADEGAERQRDRRGDERGASALLIRERADAEPPRETSDDHDGDDGAFGEVIAAEAQVFGDVREGRVDDCGVVAEEEGAEARGDDGRMRLGPTSFQSSPTYT